MMAAGKNTVFLLLLVLLQSMDPSRGQNSGIGLIYDSVTMSSYTVVESAGTLLVCIRANNTVNEEFSVTLSTFSAGSATAGVDYTAIQVEHTFTPFTTLTRCSTITIIDDDMVEGEEFFFLQLTSDDSSLTLPGLGSVTITNDDFVTLGFSQPTFTTTEGSPASVCAIIISGSIATSVSFSVTQTDGTASANTNDYVNAIVSDSISPAQSGSPKCVNIPTNPDTKVEGTETFEISLSSVYSIETSDATVFLEDDDGVIISLVSPTLSVSEGNTGSTSSDFCVQLTNIQSSLLRDVQLLLTTETVAGQADASDFVPLSDQLLTLPSTTAVGANVCYQLSITGDNTCEEDETFLVSVTPVDSLDTISGTSVATVTILDDGDSIEDCGPLSISDGSIQYAATVRGFTATYSCSLGYVLVGVSSRVCEATGTFCVGQWSGSSPTCRLADCGIPDMPSNGVTSYTTTTYLSVADYTCNVGYTRNGVSSRTCQANEQWTDSAPVCDSVVCPAISAPDNGQLSLTNGVVFGSRASYSCNQGYDLVNGASIRSCRANGVWSSVAPTCAPVDCLGLNNPTNGEVSLTGTTFMHTATYTCLSGFFLVGDETRTCQFNRLWTSLPPQCIVDCGIITVPVNGMLVYDTASTLLNSVVTYSCDEGYLLEGDQSRTCLDTGVWSGSNSICQPVDCFSLSDPTNGQAVYTTTTLGSMTTFTCNLGYLLSINIVRVCQTNGDWSGVSPSCLRVVCGTLPDPTSGMVALNPGTDFGSVATYSCVTGYNLVGISTRTCQQNGIWSNEQPTCQIVDCGPPSNPGNGDVSFGLTTFGSIAAYMCISGYRLSSASFTRSCQADSEWSEADPTCNPVDCGSFPSPENGNVVMSPSTTFQSTATYSCNEGYDIIGNIIRVCESDGDWSLSGISDPTCQAVNCGGLTDPANGVVSFTTTTFQSEATYSCNLGYLLEGVGSRTCQADRIWSDTIPVCEPVDCLGLNDPAEGIVDLSEGTELGAVASYVCDIGFMLVGTEQRMCGVNAMWTNSEPICEVVTCPENLVHPANGFFRVIGGYTFGSIVTYQCNNTYAIIGQATRTCGSDGMWTDSTPTCTMIGCSMRDDPENGSSTQLTPGLIQYMCDDGFELNDMDLAISLCNSEDGTWSDAVPTCIINDCGPPPLIDGGNLMFTTTTYLSEAVYSCASGFQVEPSSSEIRTCQADETWSGSDPTCEPVSCGPLDDPEDGQVSADSIIRGSEAVYSCNQNYSLNGDTTRVCMDDSMWSGNEPICEDIDECGENIDRCNQSCLNTDGGYKCDCLSGFELQDFSSCVDINECETNNGGCSQVCVNTDGSSFCQCLDGYTIDFDGRNCNDVNECLLSLDNCHSNASCVNTVGGFDCSCDQGFEGNGVDCLDINECDRGTHSCHQFASCTNTIGNSTCSCLVGFAGDGLTCNDINECQDGNVTCTENAECMNTISSYDCSCRQGFTLNGDNCTDTDECITGEHICHEFSTCENAVGFFSCSCNDGFRGDGVDCENIDECQEKTDSCHENADCTDTAGNYTCSCKEGFTGDGRNCTDRCTTLFQLVLNNVGDCALWRIQDTSLKLNDTIKQVALLIKQSCNNCNFERDQILEPEFNCLDSRSIQEVTFRARLRGSGDSDCSELISQIGLGLQQTQASITVQGNRLKVATNCEIEIDNFSDDLVCLLVTTGTVGVGVSTEAVSLPVIVGGAVGGLVLVVLLVILLIVIIATIIKKKRRKSVEIPTHFIDSSDANEYSSLSGVRAHPNNYFASHLPIQPQTSTSSFVYEGNRDLRQSTFNPEGDVIPMLGRSYSTISRNRIRAEEIKHKDPNDDEFVYDTPYDDGTDVTAMDVEEVYDIVNKQGNADMESSGELSADNPLYDKPN